MLASIKLLPVRMIAYHICFVLPFLPLALVDLDPCSIKIEFVVTKVNRWTMLLLLQKVPSYIWKGS